MEFLKKLFSENSDVSSGRVMSMMALVAAIALAFYGMTKSTPDMSGIAMVSGAFLAAAFTGKVASKFAENKDGKKDA